MNSNIVITVGDNIVLNDGLVGTVRFIGEIEKQHGVYYGIELTEKRGNCRGIVNGTKYFDCKPSYGLFVTKAKITHAKGMRYFIITACILAFLF